MEKNSQFALAETCWHVNEQFGDVKTLNIDWWYEMKNIGLYTCLLIPEFSVHVKAVYSIYVAG